MKPFRMKENSYIERIDSFNVRIRVMYCLSERALFMKELFPLKQSARVCYSVFTRFDEGPSHILEIPPRLVDVFPLERSSFRRGGEYLPCKQWGSGR